MRNSLFTLALIAIVWACAPPARENVNPAAPGFDAQNSDPAAIALADSIMKAMGGRENWDATRFISWTFFGRRTLTWDKHLGRARIVIPKDSIIFLVDLKNGTGRMQQKGIELTEPDSLQKMMKKAVSIWINDSYWLVMPFKLKDDGVTLKVANDDSVVDSRPHNILQLTFANVGDTPDNKYWLAVDKSDKLITKWSFFSQAALDTPNFTRPWDNYKQYGSILLSGDRSDGGGPAQVAVHETLPETVFTEF
jgi:hypothetical protein